MSESRSPAAPQHHGAAIDEVDEFGLPQRRYPSPSPSPTTVDDAKPSLDGNSVATDSEKNPKEGGGAGEVRRVETEPNPSIDQNSDSEDQQFEDADSVPAPEPVQGEKKPVEGEPSTPVPPDSKTFQPREETKDAESKQLPKDSVEPSPSTPTARDAPATESTQKASQTDPEKAETRADHNRNTSTASATIETGLSEFSHQQLPVREEAQDDDGGWQTMPSFARYDMYDDDDRLIARERTELEDEAGHYNDNGRGGAGKGYTRVIMDEDAESATSMDDHTQYLFKGTASTSITADDEEARDAVSQMQATKDLLTEGQRIAYVGVVRLEIAKMVEEAEALIATKKTKKETSIAAEGVKMWGQKMMIRLYTHMEISEAEQIMIEQLAEHGVVPTDLTPALLANSRVHNPMAGTPRSEHGESSSSPPPYKKEDGGDKTETVSGSDGDDDEKREKGTETKDEDVDSSAQADEIAVQISRAEEAASPAEERAVEEGEEQAAEPPPPYEKGDGEELPDVKTPSQMPTTAKIDIDLRWTVLCDLFLILIADSIYDARSRVLLEKVAESLDISWIDICKFEKRVTDALEMQQAAEKEDWNEEEHMESRRKAALKKRYMMMGLATVGGGLVIGLSAGLLAPVIGAGLAAGFTTIGVTGTSSFLAGAGGAAVITSSAVASGSFMGGKAAHRRTGAVKTFEYRPLHNNKRVNLVVTVSGWLTGKVDDVRLPFSTVDSIVGDIYSVLWEPEMLRSMGDTINILATEALTQGLQQVLGSTILMALMAALQLPIVLSKLAYLIDNPWAVSLDRATSAGLILADSLIERSLGTRPITLVGYSLGARVIFSCLQELAKKGAYGLVQNVYLFGSPVVVKKEEYIRARTVVSGRFVNGFNRNDWILGYLFRLTNGGIRRVAGLAPIDDCPFVENMDVTEFVTGHMEYRTAMPTLLMECGWPVESAEFTEIEDPDPENHQGRQRELINEIEEARRELEKEGKAKKANKFSLFGRRKKAEKQEWELYDESTVKAAGATAAENSDGTANNQAVLFDIDAIRAELNKEAKENGVEELQIREIESTLPPMKLEIPPRLSTSTSASAPTPAAQRPGGIPESKSADVIPMRGSLGGGARTVSASASPSPSGFASRPSPQWTPMEGNSQQNLHADPYRAEEEVSMTFDTSFDDSGRPPPPPPPKDGEQDRGLQTNPTNAVPSMTLRDPWGDPDDENFGKEQEISMTFA